MNKLNNFLRWCDINDPVTKGFIAVMLIMIIILLVANMLTL